MSPKQHRALRGRLWPTACRAQGWNPDDKTLRLRVLSEAVGRPITSSTQINETDDFDAVKRHLLTRADSVSGAMDSAEAGEARRTMNHVRALLAELEELHPAPGEYVQTLLRGIKRGRRVESGGVEDLGTSPRIENGREKISELEQFRRTLNARIHGRNGLAHKGSLQTAPEPEPELVEEPF